MLSCMENIPLGNYMDNQNIYIFEEYQPEYINLIHGKLQLKEKSFYANCKFIIKSTFRKMNLRYILSNDSVCEQ